MKRVVCLFVVTLLIMTSIPVMAGGKSQQGSDVTTITTLTRWTGADAFSTFWSNFCANFEKANPSIKINDISVNEEAAFNNRFRTMVATGEVPNFFYMPGIASLVPYAKSKMIADVSPLFADKEWYDGFIPGAFDMFRFDSYGVPGVYAIPFAAAPEGVYYNVEFFRKIGYNKFPETIPEFYDAMDKLKAIGIVPIAPGARDTWRTGHIHNQFLYKWAGVQAAMDLGARKMKWTDPVIVETLAYVKDMKDRGYFIPNLEAIPYDMERAMFVEQKSAMAIQGTWFIGELLHEDVKFEVGLAPFPYFPQKPQFKGHIANYPQHYVMKGGMKGTEYDATVKFFKEFTGRENLTKMVAEYQVMPIRKDIDVSKMNVSSLFPSGVAILTNSTSQGGDSFDFDQLASMQDVTRNAIIGMLLGNTPAATAKQIQDAIDRGE